MNNTTKLSPSATINEDIFWAVMADFDSQPSATRKKYTALEGRIQDKDIRFEMESMVNALVVEAQKTAFAAGVQVGLRPESVLFE